MNDKETDETLLWLELFEEAQVCPAHNKFDALKREADELLRLFSSSLGTARCESTH